MQKILDTATMLWRNDNELGAINLLNKIIEKSGPANTLIGNMYVCAQKGQSNIKKDYKKAKKYYQKAVNLKDPEGAVELGQLYYFGDGVKLNYKKAELYWEIAYKLGDETGAFKLANLYYDYQHEKIEKAISIYSELIVRNEFVGNCQYKLSRIYGMGIGIKKSPSLEFIHLTEGTEHFDYNCCIALASKYIAGDGVKKDLKKALAIIKKADARELFDDEKKALIKFIKSKMK